MILQEDTIFDNRYALQKLIGRGGFSEVWLAKDQWTHLNVAIKVYAPGQGMEEDGMKEFCGELAGVYDLNHPNLLKPQHVDAWENMPYLIMTYCPNGSCAQLVGKVSETQMWNVIHDVASGLAYLHENEVVHQDIKPANVLVAENRHYQITDFGVSSRARSTLRKSVVLSTGGGTTAYMGPERFSQQPAPTKASDIWSFGAMCFEMLEGDVPFGEIGGGLQKGGAEIPLMTANVSDSLKFVITKMLQKETWDRPTAAKLVEWSANPTAIDIDCSLMPGEIPQKDIDSGRTTVKRNYIPSEPEKSEKVQEPIVDNSTKKSHNCMKRGCVISLVIAAIIFLFFLLVFAIVDDSVDEQNKEAVEVVQQDTMVTASRKTEGKSGKKNSEISTMSIENKSDTTLNDSVSVRTQTFMNGTYYIESAVDNCYVLTSQGPAETGMKMLIWENEGNPNQKWILIRNSDGTFTLRTAMNTKFVLDLNNSVHANGSVLQLREANNTHAQKWRLVKCGSYYRIVSSYDENWVVDVKYGKMTNGNAVWLWEKNEINGAYGQKWILHYIDSNTSSITAE